MAQITVTTAAPTAGTPLFVPAVDAVNKLVMKARDAQVEIDWATGVTLKTVEPSSVTVGDAQIAVDGVILVQAEAQTVEQPQPAETDTADSASAPVKQTDEVTQSEQSDPAPSA